jgi:hypothetical protein
MNRPRLAVLFLALALIQGAAAQSQSKGAAPAEQPLAAPERTDRPAAAGEWKDGENIVRAYVSSERSAPAGSFGEWFGVESVPAPKGWVLKTAKFNLVGDRDCSGTEPRPKGAGTLSECRQDLRNDRVVRWAFRFAGRDPAEEANPWKLKLAVGLGEVVTSGAVRTTRGILICTYAPAAAAPTAAAPTTK